MKASWVLFGASALVACGAAPGSVLQTNDVGTVLIAGARCVDQCLEAPPACSGDTVTACVRQSNGCLEPRTLACTPGVEVCRQGACSALSERQRGWAEALRAAAALIDGNAGFAPASHVELEATVSALQSELFHAPDEPASFYRAVRKLSLAWPIGHLAVIPLGACGGPDNPFASSSTLGVCAQPYRDHAVISYAQPTNPLGLVAGDEIVGVDGVEGVRMMNAALEQPLCGNSSASASNRRATAATSLFAGARVGTRVSVKHLDGSVEQKTVTALAARVLSCRDPFAREVPGIATATLRPDGIGVIHVARFHIPGNTSADVGQVLAAIRVQLVAAFDQVKNAPGIVWDLRANEGGSTFNGLEIVAGVTGASIGMDIGGYQSRFPGTQTFTTREPYVLTASSTFAYAGKTAFLTDGLTISAADYTVRAVRLATLAPIVGQPASGSYGGGSAAISTSTSPIIQVYPDPYLGVDAAGAPIEGVSAVPTELVELEPVDLAAGRDTVLEHAVLLVK